MTISTTIVKNSYSGDGSTTTFSYTFKVLANSDLTVIIRSALGTETTKTLNTHYTITGVGDAAGGSITFTAGNIPTATETVVLIRDTTQTQAIDYVANDPFPAESHEEGLDRSVILSQEIQEEVDRSIKLSRTNTMTNTEFTVGPTDRANKVLSFDSAGELNVTQELGIFKGNWSSGETFVIRDIVKDTTNNNIYICQTAHTSSGSLPLSSNADIGKWSLIVDAASATTSANNAAASATAAAASETAAATSETNAATSATNAATSETNAATSATNAANSATAAATSASNASTSETNAATSETNAASSATAAASSATSAATQASNAATSATNAATSETNAASSATAAASSASAASTSASNASTSETNAASSATAAASSATSAASSAASAAASYDSFDDRYLGPKSSDPTVDNDGDALLDGALYFNTVSNVLKYWNGTTWEVVESTDTSNLATNGFSIAMAIAL